MVLLNRGPGSPYLVGASWPGQNYPPAAAWERGAGRHYLNPTVHRRTHHRPSLRIPSPHYLSLGPMGPRYHLEPQWGLDRRVKAPAHPSARQRPSHGTARNLGQGCQRCGFRISFAVLPKTKEKYCLGFCALLILKYREDISKLDRVREADPKTGGPPARWRTAHET